MLLPLLDLRPWTGRIYLDEFDAIVLLTLGANLWRGRYAVSLGSMHPLARLLLLAFLLLVSISLGQALSGMQPIDANALATYYSDLNAVRAVKGLLAALLLYPIWIAETRLDRQHAQRSLLLGMSLAAIGVFAVVLWERGLYSTLLFWTNKYAPIKALLNFSTEYRATGLFADMHTGGTAIDGWLLLTAPFAAAAFFTARRPWLAILPAIALFGILYSALVTFSRGVYLGIFVALFLAAWLLAMRARSRARIRDAVLSAVAAAAIGMAAFVGFRSGGVVSLAYGLIAFLGGAALILFRAGRSRGRWLPMAAGVALGLVLLSTWTIIDRDYAFLPLPAILQAALCILPGLGAGTWIGWRVRGALPFYQVGATLLAVAAFLFILVPSLFGYRMDMRFADSWGDLQHRLDHWKVAVSIMDSDRSTRLFGQGLGRFPRTYYLMHQDPATYGGFRFEREGANQYLLLRGDHNMVLGQRLSLEPHHLYRLSFNARTGEEPVRLYLRICHRKLVLPYRWNPSCVNLHQKVAASNGHWNLIEKSFDSGKLGSFERGLQGWLTLEIANRSKGQGLGIDDLSILDAFGREWMDNGDFERGIDRWLPYYDFDHLSWHIKNLWVHVYFELGLIGLTLFLLLGMAALITAVRSASRDPLAFALATALAGFFAVGAFGTIIDAPRDAFLFWLIILLALSSRQTARSLLTSRSQVDGAGNGTPIRPTSDSRALDRSFIEDEAKEAAENAPRGYLRADLGRPSGRWVNAHGGPPPRNMKRAVGWADARRPNTQSPVGPHPSAQPTSWLFHIWSAPQCKRKIAVQQKATLRPYIRHRDAESCPIRVP